MKNRVMSGGDIQYHEGFKSLDTPSKIADKEEDVTLILNDSHLKSDSFEHLVDIPSIYPV